jgi:hypothetical protein
LTPLTILPFKDICLWKGIAMTLNKSIGHYWLVFFLAFIGISIIIGIIGSFLSSGMGGMVAVVPFISAMLAGGRFLKVEKRLPTEAERSKLTTGSFLIFLAINVLLIGIALSTISLMAVSSSDVIGRIILILAIIMTFVLLISYFMIRWAYGGLLRKQAEKMRLNNSPFD